MKCKKIFKYIKYHEFSLDGERDIERERDRDLRLHKTYYP